MTVHDTTIYNFYAILEKTLSHYTPLMVQFYTIYTTASIRKVGSERNSFHTKTINLHHHPRGYAKKLYFYLL